MPSQFSYEQEFLGDLTHRGEGNVMTEAETGVMQLEAKEHQRLLANARTKTRHGRIIPAGFQTSIF